MRCPECGKDNREGARFCDGCGTPLQATGADAPAGEAAVSERRISDLAERAAPLAADAPAEVGSGRFRTLGFLGAGTRKTVYLATDRECDDEPVAVAVFSTEGVAAGVQARARREVEAMATLGRHPHLVGVLASGQDGERPYIASEYMPGGNLLDLLDAAPSRRLGVERALAVALEISAGLEHAHSKGIVHRDIKPANVWLDADGSARLGDFGLAVTDRRSREEVERMVVGTAAYLPPEQATGGRCDARADLYSLGAVIHEMLTGEPPFPGDDAVSIITRHLSAEPLPPSRHEPEVPDALDALVLQLLAKSPADRPADAREVRSRLTAIAAAPLGRGAEERPAPNPLDELAGGVFVGRDGELDQLRDLAETALGGRGGVALIEGEAGIGKTRLVEELMTYARVRGARLLVASCHEADSVPAYWPFAQAIRSYVRDADPVGLAWQLGADGPEIARLVPELRSMVPSIGSAPPIEEEEGRYRFYEAVAGFLVGVASSRPLVLILDDVHWADSSSAELLRYLSHRIAGHPLLVVCAYREEEASRSEPLMRALDELDQVPNRVRLALGGLDRAAIARYVELTTGEAPREELASELHEQTGGNPFFVGEVVRLLAAEGTDGASQRGPRTIPRGVREAVGRRLARLSEQTVEMLEAAAVIGRRFDREVLCEMLETEPEDSLAEALAARVIAPRPGSGETHGFVHAVFRETIYDGIAPARRADLHRDAGEAIERLYGDSALHLPALARHFIEAGGEADRPKAVEYATAAGRRSAEGLAHAAAADQLERALGAMGEEPSPERLALLIELGDEQTRSGRFGGARETLWQAAELADRLGDQAARADAALAICALSEVGSVNAELIALLEDLLEGCAADDDALRARLLAALAQEYYWEDPTGKAAQAAADALESARRSDDDGALAAALVSQQFAAVIEPEQIEIRLAGATELLETARRAGDRRNEVRAHAYRLSSLLQLGDVAAADAALAEYQALADRLAEPRNLWHVPVIQATREMMRGNFAEARRLSGEGLRLGRLAEEPLSEQFHTLQMALLHTFEGSVEEMLPTVRRMSERYPTIPAWRLALISFLVEADRADEARVEFAPIAAAGFERIPRDANWLVGVTRVAQAAAALGDGESCAALYEAITPFAGEVIIVGRGSACNGPVDRYLGLTAAASGEHERAIEHLNESIAICTRMGDRPFRADSRLHLGLALIASGEREQALDVLGLALEEGLEIGMRRMVERAVRARLEAQGVASVDVTASIDSVALAVAAERPDLGPIAAPDGRVTILFSDIENSTLMTERLGDRRWIEVLRRHNSVFRRRLESHGGYEVKSQGDGFMLAFPDPAEALRCAAGVQQDLEAELSATDERIRVRMGLHVGEAIHEEGDFFGRSVILAARIAAQARGGEILVSEELRDSGGGEAEFGEPRELELKGLAGVHRVFGVDWQAAGMAVATS